MSSALLWPRVVRTGLVVAFATVVVVGCGTSSSSTKSASAGAGSGSTVATTTAPMAGGVVGPTVPGSGGGGAPASGSPSSPAVANATDLTKEPVIAAGTGPPPTQVVTVDLVVGTGPQAVATNSVHVQYVGANFADGKVFDSSWSRGQPADFPLNGVVPGFAQGIEGMHVGGRREIVIPPDQGYGAQGSPPAVGPNETLVFVVDLLGVS